MQPKPARAAIRFIVTEGRGEKCLGELHNADGLVFVRRARSRSDEEPTDFFAVNRAKLRTGAASAYGTT